jgi:hypothetical protein
MKNRLDTRLIGRARRVLLVGVPAVGLVVAMVGVTPAQQASAQEIDIGASIAETVAEAVAGIASPAGESSTASGGLVRESSEIQLGEEESTAISDASGGNGNVSAKE